MFSFIIIAFSASSLHFKRRHDIKAVSLMFLVCLFFFKKYLIFSTLYTLFSTCNNARNGRLVDTLSTLPAPLCGFRTGRRFLVGCCLFFECISYQFLTTSNLPLYPAFFAINSSALSMQPMPTPLTFLLNSMPADLIASPAAADCLQ